MNNKITFGRVVVTILAVIGGLTLLVAVAMFGMHMTMMSGTSGSAWQPMTGTCKGMMGS